MNNTKLIAQIEIKPFILYLSKILAGSLLIAVSAQISIPFYPVPMTLQPMALMFLGLMTRPSVAAGAVSLYFLEAYVGLPVLSGFTGGPAHLLGTRGGFILAFLPLSVITSYVSSLKDSISYKILGCTLGNLVLYTSGIVWLSQLIGLDKALQFGLLVILAGLNMRHSC